MGQKQDRQKKILELIEKENVTTQEDMIEHLREAGFDVTQATVSRDIREMGLVKKTDKNGICHYVEMTSHGKKGGIHNALTDSVVKVDFAGNILVIKTLPVWQVPLPPGWTPWIRRRFLAVLRGTTPFSWWYARRHTPTGFVRSFPKKSIHPDR